MSLSEALTVRLVTREKIGFEVRKLRIDYIKQVGLDIIISIIIINFLFIIVIVIIPPPPPPPPPPHHHHHHRRRRRRRYQRHRLGRRPSIGRILTSTLRRS